MPLPTAQDLRPIDTLMTDFAIATGPDIAQDYVADLAVPPVQAKEPSGTYFVWDAGDQYRREMKLTGDYDPAPVGGFRVGTDTYFTLHYTLKTALPDRARDRAPNGRVADEAQTYYLTAQSKANRDYLFKEACFKTGKWTGNTEQTGVSTGASTNEFLQFNDSSSIPLKVLQNYMLGIRLKCGRMPNLMITNLDVLSNLARHADFTGRVTGGGTTAAPSVVDEDIIAKILWSGFKTDGRIVVAKAIDNTAAEGATDTLSDMFGKNILLAYQDPKAQPIFDQARVTAMAQFVWQSHSGVTPDGAVIRSYPVDDPKGTMRLVEDDVIPKITMQTAGQFLKSAVA